MRPGLYYVHGRNEAEPWLEGNGVGKSNLFEALYWCLYGTTSENLRGSTIKNWHSTQKCLVITELDVPAGRLAVLRQQGPPNTLEISLNDETPRAVDQTEIETLLGLASEAFLFSIYQAQFLDRFLDLQAAKQMAVYSTVLGLDLWEQASASASARARAIEQEVNAVQQRLAGLEGQAQALAASSHDKDEIEWNETTAHAIRTHELEQEKIKSELIDLRRAAEKYRKGSETFRKKRELGFLAREIVAVHVAEERRLEREIVELKRKDLKNCPVCGTELKRKDHIGQEVKRLEALKEKAKANIKEHTERLDERMRDTVKYRDDEDKLLDAEKAVSQREEAQRGSEQVLQQLRTQKNPYTALKQEQAQRARQLKKDLEETETSLALKEREQKGTQFWTGGFKQVRLMLIKESLTQLQVEANESLYQLGLRDWSLEFDVERETKSGTIDRNFTVEVRAPKLKDPQPWKAWCGGERQRLRVAGTLGFSNLISSRLAVQPNLEIWDEPTAWMSGMGIRDLLECLSERAQQQQKIILLADHKVLDSAAFSGTIQLIKDSGGTRIEL